QMQSIFEVNWKEVSGESLEKSEYFPDFLSPGNLKGQIVHSVPESGKGVIHQMFLFAIKSAQNYLYIENAYFVPDAYTLKSLKETARRGVDVRILVPSPGKTDVSATAYAARNFYKELIRSGIKIYEYEKQILHSKFMVIDDRWVSLGSANMDIRSMMKSQEANLNVLDRQFALNLKKIFQKDIKDSRRITLEEYKKRSILSRINQLFVNLVESQL
ncbi:MAG: phospholipase D-like domain-containing protein, partial [Spirochaetia bacterium]|nr:phospholipase D-like domain-containing protein [Spirochaetia bacterium]